MSLLTIYKGRKGKPGADGINGLDSLNTNDYKISSPILDCLQPNVLSNNAFVEWERDRVSAYVDRYGNDVYSLPTSATNYMPYSEDFTKWDDVLSQWSIIGAISDPFGGNTATEIELDADTRNPGGNIPVMGDIAINLPPGSTLVASFYIRRISGTIDTVEYSEDSVYYDLKTISDSWERKVIKFSNDSASSRFGISPRGSLGARFAVTAVQLEEIVLTQSIKTTGEPVTLGSELYPKITGDTKRQSDSGYLIEGEKQNLARLSHDFKGWSIVDGLVDSSSVPDAFGFNYSKTRLVFSSLPTITASTPTEVLTPLSVYTVSFYAFLTGGSLSALTVSLGDGDAFTLAQPSIAGFKRMSIKVTAGVGDTITIKATSQALNAQLNIGCFQIETGELSSYIDSGKTGQTRPSDDVFMAYKYNAPLPSGDWSFVFGKNIPNDDRIKTVFSNGEVGANEFSLSYQNRILTLNNGGNTTSVDLFDYEKAAVVYDGVNVKFYGEQLLISTVALSSTSFISTQMHIGSNGTDEYINGFLYGCLFYNEALDDNDIIYLLGV